jgi:hypothetical protein
MKLTATTLSAALLLISVLTACTSPVSDEPFPETVTTSTTAETEHGTPAEPPDSVTDSPFLTENITVGEGGDFPLDGKLTVPRNASAENPVPAVVLVHGSGASNMDEEVYGYKPFRDIADFLSADGIAVIRYDKRIYAHEIADLSGFTVMEETVEDAVLAAQILQDDERIDSNRIFVLGHSMGGMLAPRIDDYFTRAGGNFAGLILWAGSPRTLWDIIYDQNMAVLADLEGMSRSIAEAQFTAFETVFNSLNDMSDEEVREFEVPNFGGLSGYYFRDMDAHLLGRYLPGLVKPVLIMHGDADFQVTTEGDFAVYQELFAGKDNATFKLYAGLNHFFAPSTCGTLAEYQTGGTVSDEVLRDIADWISAS